MDDIVWDTYAYVREKYLNEIRRNGRLLCRFDLDLYDGKAAFLLQLQASLDEDTAWVPEKAVPLQLFVTLSVAS